MFGCAPGASELVVNWATPPARTPLPSSVAPSKKSTLPVAMPAPGALTMTVAVNVTFDPAADGVPLVLNAVVVLALFTVCAAPPDALVLKLPSPAYVATSVFGAPGEVEARLHVPAATAALHDALPSLTVTLPVSATTAAPGAFTVTFQLTAYGWPTTVAVPRVPGAPLVMTVVVSALFTVCAVPDDALPL